MSKDTSLADHRSIRIHPGLWLPGLIGFGGYTWLATGLDAVGGREDVLAFLGASAMLYGTMFVAWRVAGRQAAGRGPLITVLAFAVAYRAVMLLAGLPSDLGVQDIGRAALEDVTGGEGGPVVYEPFLLYDNDVWRYLWDGHVAAAGFDPYRLTPAAVADSDDVEIAALLNAERWFEIHERVAFGRFHSVYPPLAQHLFRWVHALAPGSVLVWKTVLAAADVATCWLLACLLGRLGRPRHDVLLYAWNPLAIKEIAGSGHVDGVAVLLIVATLWLAVTARSRWASAAWAGAVLVKISPLVLGPLLLNRIRPRAWWPAVLFLAVASWPLRDGLADLVGGLAVFSERWTFNGGPWALIAHTAYRLGVDWPPTWANAITRSAVIVVTLVGAWWIARSPAETRDLRLVTAAFLALATLAWTSPAVMPWYLLWATPLAVVAGCRSWLILGALSMLSYLVYIDDHEAAWWLVLEHGLFVVLAGVELWQARRHRLAPQHREVAPSDIAVT